MYNLLTSEHSVPPMRSRVREKRAVLPREQRILKVVHTLRPVVALRYPRGLEVLRRLRAALHKAAAEVLRS